MNLSAGLGRIAALVTLMLATAACAADQEVTIARTVKQGDTARWKHDLTAKVGGQDVTGTHVAKRTVKEVRPGGEIVIDEFDEPGELTVMGATQPLAGGPAGTATLDRRGKIVKFVPPSDENSPWTADMLQLLEMFRAPVFPEKPVASGAEWTTEYANPLVKDRRFQLKTAFLGMEKLDGKDSLKVRQAGSADAGDGTKVTSEFTYWLDPATGTPVKIESSQTGVPSKYGPMDLTGTFVLIPAAEAK